MSFLIVFFCLVLISIWVVSGGYITDCSVKLRGLKGKDPGFEDAFVYSTWAAVITWLLIGLIIVLIILAMAGVVALFATGVGEVGAGGAAAADAGLVAEEAAVEEAEVGAEKLEQKAAQKAEQQGSKALKQGKFKKGKKKRSSFFTWLFFIGSMILVFITGSLSAAAANSIRTASSYDQNKSALEKPYNDAIIAAIMCLSSVGLIIIGMISYAVYRHKQKTKGQEQQREKQIEMQTMPPSGGWGGYFNINPYLSYAQDYFGF